MEGENIEFLYSELVPLGDDHKFMDGHYRVDGIYQQNVEFQSTPVYSPKMIDMYKYMVYSLAEEYTEFHTCVFATYPPNQGIRELKIGDAIFKPRFFFTKNLKAREVIKTVENKNNEHIPLTDNEAIDLLIAPDMEHDYEMRELLEKTSLLLIDATIDDKEFHIALMDCQKKVLQRCLRKDERKEFEEMINLKVEDFGFKPHVTGFEESVNLAFLDGKREGFSDGEKKGFSDGEKKGIDDTKLATAKRLIELGCDDEFIAKATDLDLKAVQKLRED